MTEQPRVLLVEDDVKTADLVALYLRHAGLHVSVEHAGDRALHRLETERFDLMVLDVMLPGVDGRELCRRVRATGDTGIIMLTARTFEEERLEGFALGADDYVPKPFSPRELVARVQAVLRRAPRSAERSLRVGTLVLDLKRHAASMDGRTVELTASEFALLAALMERPGHVRSRTQLLDRLTDGPQPPLDRTVDAHIKNLRRKLDPGGGPSHIIETVIGVGYRIGVPPADRLRP
jgi:DNA-binding response OmpR family regulator